MNNNNVLEEFFVWEEKSLIDRNQNLLKNAEQDNSVTTIETKTDSIPKDWRDITNAKLRKKMRDKAWRKANKDKIKIKGKIYCKSNKDKIKAWRKANKDKIKDRNKVNYEINKDKIKIKQKAYYQYNKDKRKAYNEANRDKINSNKKNRLKTDIQYKLSHNLRLRLHSAIKNNQKIGSAVKDLGCTIDELKTYLESKFQSEMTWDNWTIDGWHIDHIKPLASFNLTNKQQFLEACHYTNLQPLWAKDNRLKSDKIL